MHQMIVVLALSVELFLVLQAQEQFLSKFLLGILNYTVVCILYHSVFVFWAQMTWRVL